MPCVLVSNLDKMKETSNTTVLDQQLTTKTVKLTVVTLPALLGMDTELDVDRILILPCYKQLS